MDNDTNINATALDFAIRSRGHTTSYDEVLAAAKDFRHFIMNGQILIQPQPEQPE